jgi:hypothetical protein
VLRAARDDATAGRPESPMHPSSRPEPPEHWPYERSREIRAPS